MKEVAQMPRPGNGRARIQTRKSPWYSRAPKYLFLQLNCAVRHWLLKKAKICKRPAGMFSSMVGIRGAYRRKTLLIPCFAPTLRTSQPLQPGENGVGFKKKMSRLIRVSGIEMEIRLGPSG